MSQDSINLEKTEGEILPEEVIATAQRAQEAVRLNLRIKASVNRIKGVGVQLSELKEKSTSEAEVAFLSKVAREMRACVMDEMSKW